MARKDVGCSVLVVCRWRLGVLLVVFVVVLVVLVVAAVLIVVVIYLCLGIYRCLNPTNTSSASYPIAQAVDCGPDIVKAP